MLYVFIAAVPPPHVSLYT